MDATYLFGEKGEPSGAHKSRLEDHFHSRQSRAIPGRVLSTAFSHRPCTTFPSWSQVGVYRLFSRETQAGYPSESHSGRENINVMGTQDGELSRRAGCTAQPSQSPRFKFQGELNMASSSSSPPSGPLVHSDGHELTQSVADLALQANPRGRSREGYGFRPSAGPSTPLPEPDSGRIIPNGNAEEEQPESDPPLPIAGRAVNNATSAIPDVNGLGWPGT